jgi:nucleoside triphosphate diphosphatase
MTKHSDIGSIEKLLEIMATLRDAERGCPWDREQTFATIAPHTIEEAYEVADAIEREALDELRGELGDLLFQVVFHARMAEELGRFSFADVAAGICDKLVRRHPHVFGGEPVAGVAEQSRVWEQIKREERAEKERGGVLGDVPLALPALSRAAKLGKRAASVGFDWPDLAGVRAKLAEETAELDEALAARGPAGTPDRAAVAAEVGDLLFTVANLARHLALDPEVCLRAANARFEARFDYVESQVAASGRDWAAHAPAELDRLWRQAKSRAGRGL